jgi:hypothetical protein
VEAGQVVTIPVTVRNIASAALEDGDLAVAVPPGAVVKEASGLEHPADARVVLHIGSLAPGETRTQEIALRFFGREGEAQEISAAFLYRPAALSAQFSSQGSRRIIIARVPLEVSWDVPQTIVARQPVRIAMRLSSQAPAPFGPLWLRADYPPGFALASTDPKPASENNLWSIGVLDPGREETVVINGSFDGTSGEVKSLRAGLGSYDELTKEWHPWREATQDIQLAATPFALSTTVQGAREGVIMPGEYADIVVHYENRSATAVKNVSITAAVDSVIADMTSVAITEGGVFDERTGAIVWGPGGTPALREVAPGQAGNLHIGINTKARPPMRTAADKNFKLRVRASIRSADAPGELRGAELSPDDTMEMKVATIALFSGRTVFRSSPILNTGPLPPRVGDKTTYVVIWEARNFTNDLDETEVSAPLPPNVRWEGATFPAATHITYDTASSEVRWSIGRLAAGTGVIAPSLTAAFQVSVIPSAADAGKTVALTGEAHASGKDQFTGEQIMGRMDPLTTELPSDQAVSPEHWRVAK